MMRAMSKSALAPTPAIEHLVLLAAATAIAPLVAKNMTPSSTMYNQIAAVGGWGLALAFAAPLIGRVRLDGALIGWLLLFAAPFASVIINGLPLSLALEAAALIGAALLVYVGGQSLTREARSAALDWLCIGLLVAGLASVVISVLQVFWPDQCDGTFIACSGLPGRAIGNMRQPNHLASLLIWGCVAAAWLSDRHLPARVGAAVLPLVLFALLFADVLSASRTGMADVLMLTFWGGIDKRLSRRTRAALICAPLLWGLGYGLMHEWAAHGHAFGAETRIHDEGAGSPSRLGILRNAMTLIARNPWVGVGWGEFNLAWTMTPFPGRPTAFFDHTHNLLVQLAVELGIPMTVVLAVLFGATLWHAFRLCLPKDEANAPARRAALMLVLTIGVHSMFEYPLWYGYFLLPGAFALGIAGGRDAPPSRVGRGAYVLIGMMLLAGSAFACWDYSRVVEIYAPPEHALPLNARIEEGTHSVLYAAQAEYAAATGPDSGAASLAAARQTGHNLIDTRLMHDWARSLHAVGDDDRARFIVQRLREFRPTGAEADWLAECNDLAAGEPRPFQCDPPKRNYDWREMR